MKHKIKKAILLISMFILIPSLCYSYDVGIDLIWGNMIPYSHWESNTHNVSYDGVAISVVKYIDKSQRWHFRASGNFLILSAERHEETVHGNMVGLDLMLRREFVITPIKLFIGVISGLSYLSQDLPDLKAHTIGSFGVGAGIIFLLNKAGWCLKYEVQGRHRSNPFKDKEFGWNTFEHYVGVSRTF